MPACNFKLIHDPRFCARDFESQSEIVYGNHLGKDMPAQSDRESRRTFILTIHSAAMFLGAALLFLMEPLFAKMALPLLGGSAAVWTTCLVFFQSALLAGYAYAHVSAKLLPRTAQVALYFAILLAALAVLPIHIPISSAPPAVSNPAAWLLGLLLMAVGLPFFALSATTLILQKWFAHSGHPHSRDPYFLYAASNSGSLLGLLIYPLAFEPLMTLGHQARLWEYGYAVFLLLAAGCAFFAWSGPQDDSKLTSAQSQGELPGPPETIATQNSKWRRRFGWVIRAFVPSSLMLGVTSALTTDVPAIPLLWVLPLALYLLSLVIVFSPSSRISHLWVSRRTPVLILAAAIPIVLKGALPYSALLLVDLLTLFAVALVCHGEIARSRPPAQHLTGFYLWISVGGVLGGAFNALLAPLIFNSLVEFPLVLVLAALLIPPAEEQEDSPAARRNDLLFPAAMGVVVAAAIWELQSRGVPAGRWFNFAVFCPAAICCLRFGTRPRRFGLGIAALYLGSLAYAGAFGKVLASERSFFGVYRVSNDAERNCRVLFHGGISHGLQSLDAARACEPLAYYTRGGPIGQVFDAFRDGELENNVAIIGLGTGALTAYSRPPHPFTFYEIDPTVLQIAGNRSYFTYVTECGPPPRFILGDARLSLRDAPVHGYGMIVLDAFSGDAIPTHLLTREAVALYLSKLKPHGVLVFDITNRYLDLQGVLGNLAQDAGLSGLLKDDANVSAQEAREGKFASEWAVIARSGDDLKPLRDQPGWNPLLPSRGERVWTDDYSNILGILRFR